MSHISWRLWDVGKSEPIKVGKASPCEGTLPGAIYFILKYQSFKAAAQANAMVGGDNASRAIPIGTSTHAIRESYSPTSSLFDLKILNWKPIGVFWFLSYHPDRDRIRGLWGNEGDPRQLAWNYTHFRALLWQLPANTFLSFAIFMDPPIFLWWHLFFALPSPALFNHNETLPRWTRRNNSPPSNQIR